MSKEDLEFPVTCHFRVVAENLSGMHSVIETIVMELGISDPVEEANESKGGKYKSFNITTLVDSREQMTKIDQALRLIDGVKMVL